MTAVYLCDAHFLPTSLPGFLLHRPRLWRFVRILLFSCRILHLLLNTIVLTTSSRPIEILVGTVSFSYHLALFSVVSVVIHLLLGHAISWAGFVPDPGFPTDYFSRVLFALVVIEVHLKGGPKRRVLGLFSVPSWLYPFLIFLLVSLFMGSAWLAHLSGLLTGYLYQFGLLSVFLPARAFFQKWEQRLSPFLPVFVQTDPVEIERQLYTYTLWPSGSYRGSLDLKCEMDQTVCFRWQLCCDGEVVPVTKLVYPHHVRAALIPSSIESIEGYPNSPPHRGVSKAVAFEFGSTLRQLDPDAFWYSEIKSLCVPASVTGFTGSRFPFPTGLCALTFEAGSQVRRIDRPLFRMEMRWCVLLPVSLESIDGLEFFDAFPSGVSRPWLPIYAVEPGSSHFRVAGQALMNFAGTELVRYFGDLPIPPLDSRVEKLAPRSFAAIPMTHFPFCEHSRLRFIRQQAFIGCEQLNAITIPAAVEVIGAHAFRHCHALREVRIEVSSELRLIEKGAFGECWQMQPVEVPSSARIRGSFRVLGTVRCEDGSQRWRVRF
jgi:membrane associated rhomboid family serine protease